MDRKQYNRLVDAVKWVIQDVRMDTGKWDQNHWAMSDTFFPLPDSVRYVAVKCPSGMCVAGNVTARNGDKFVVESDMATLAQRDGTAIDVYTVLDEHGSSHTVERRAQALLGITFEDLDEFPLFGGNNTIEAVIHFAGELANRYGFDLNEQIPESEYADVVDGNWSRDDLDF